MGCEPSKCCVQNESIKYCDQDYLTLKKDQKSQKKLFSDSHFPAKNKYLLDEHNSNDIIWLREPP